MTINSPEQYKVLLYSLDGRLLSSFSAYEWSLGIKSLAWSPSSQFLAIGSFDEKVRTDGCGLTPDHQGEHPGWLWKSLLSVHRPHVVLLIRS